MSTNYKTLVLLVAALAVSMAYGGCESPDVMASSGGGCRLTGSTRDIRLWAITSSVTRETTEHLTVKSASDKAAELIAASVPGETITVEVRGIR